MGKTITEKILAKAAGNVEVSPGEYLEVTSGRPVHLGNLTGARGGLEKIVEWGVGVFNPQLIKIVDGHFGATASHNVGELRREMKEWARAVGIPQKNMYTLGRAGGESSIAADNAWALPGEIYLAGANGHSSTNGGLGAFAFGLSAGKNAYLVTGKEWVCVPESVKMVINGTLPKGVVARDIFEYVLSQIGPTGAGGGVVEWTGPVIDELSMGERFSLCSSAIFIGAWTAIVNPDQKTIDYVRSKTSEAFDPEVSDPDAKYAKVYEFDVSNLEPLVVPPPKRFDVKPVTELEGTEINYGFIGVDVGGWIEHMRLAASILKGRKIHPNVILNITPNTSNTLMRVEEEGLLKIFLEAECVVPIPCDGMEWGANTPLASGDVVIATVHANYPGRMGSTEAEIYMANPATVAASCIEGKITDPRKYL